MSLMIRSVKIKYNTILKTFWKATMHLEATEIRIIDGVEVEVPKITYKQQEKWMPKYEEVVKECQSYLTQLYNLGYRATEEEIKRGFNLEKEEEVEQIQI